MPATILQPERIEAHVLEAAISNPVRNSFRTLSSRTALVVRITDADGACGWGEIWCNYPPGAAAHRAQLLEQVVGPMILGRSFPHPGAAHDFLDRATRVPAIQSGEPGPFAQVVAGIDVALWDIAARRAGEPLWRWLGGTPTVRVYASGLGPDRPERLAAEKIDEGFGAVKIKVGFDAATDFRNLRALRDLLGDDNHVMVDANQRWTYGEAVEASRALAEFRPLWLEEPLPADEPLEAWRALARESRVPLAAGENLRGRADIGAAIGSGALVAIQPDIGKWGGYTGCLDMARHAADAGVQFCPHWLGGGIGLMASLHLLAAAGGKGWGEVDANPNPLRTLFLPEGLHVREGCVTLGEAPGLGFIPDAALLKRFRA